MTDQTISSTAAEKSFPECCVCMAESPNLSFFAIHDTYILRKALTKEALECPKAKSAYETISGGKLAYTRTALQKQFTDHGFVKVSDDKGKDVKVGSYTVYAIGSLDGSPSSYIYSSHGVVDWTATLITGKTVHKEAKKAKAKLRFTNSPSAEDLFIMEVLYPADTPPSGDGNNAAASLGGESPPSPAAAAAAAAAVAGGTNATNSSSPVGRADIGGAVPHAAGANAHVNAGLLTSSTPQANSKIGDSASDDVADAASASAGNGNGNDNHASHGHGGLGGLAPGAVPMQRQSRGVGDPWGEDQEMGLSSGPGVLADAAAAAGAAPSPDSHATAAMVDKGGTMTTPALTGARKRTSSYGMCTFSPKTNGDLSNFLGGVFPSPSPKKLCCGPPDSQRGAGVGGTPLSSPGLLPGEEGGTTGHAAKQAHVQSGGAATGMESAAHRHGDGTSTLQKQQHQQEPKKPESKGDKAPGAAVMGIDLVVGNIGGYCHAESIGRLVCASKSVRKLILPSKESGKDSVIKGDSSVWSLLCDAALGQSCHKMFESVYRETYAQEKHNLGEGENIKYPSFSRDIYMAHVVGCPVSTRVFRELHRNR